MVPVKVAAMSFSGIWLRCGFQQFFSHRLVIGIFVFSQNGCSDRGWCCRRPGGLSPRPPKFPPAPQIQPPTPSKGLCLNRHRGQTSEHARRIAWKSLHSICKSYRHVATSSCGQEQGNFLCISRKFIGDE